MGEEKKTPGGFSNIRGKPVQSGGGTSVTAAASQKQKLLPIGGKCSNKQGDTGQRYAVSIN